MDLLFFYFQQIHRDGTPKHPKPLPKDAKKNKTYGRRGNNKNKCILGVIFLRFLPYGILGSLGDILDFGGFDWMVLDGFRWTLRFYP